VATTLEIVNQALYSVGAEPIAAYPDTTTERGRVVSASWDFARREVLRSHSWNIATTRVKLISYAPEPAWGFDKAYDLPSDSIKVLEVDTTYDWRVENDRILTDGAIGGTLSTTTSAFDAAPTAANPVVVTLNSHTHSEGDVIRITGADMTELNDRNFRIANTTMDTFELEGEDGTGRTTGAVGTLAIVTLGDLGVRYIRDITTDAVLETVDASLTQVFVLSLAVAIVDRITDSTTKRQVLMVDLEERLYIAKRNDGEEQSPAEFDEDKWITVRF
jgi:hypothetical protein